MQKLHLEILDDKRKELFAELGTAFGGKYYLAGGTALALQLGHRTSLDFDLFGDKPLTFRLKQQVARLFAGRRPSVLVDTADELSLTVTKNVKISFINYYWPPLFPLIKTAARLPLLSIKDIATTKAYALGRRGNYRDYFDLYVILKEGHCNLKQLIKWCQRKYGEMFSSRMLLEQLTYFGDLVVDEKIKLIDPPRLTVGQMGDFFNLQVKRL